MTQISLSDPNLDQRLQKSDRLEKIDFEGSVERGVQSVFKAGDDFVIWGPASVELVDKEGDKIKAEALNDALPQLLSRARLSLEHSDQIVGRILERFETEEPVKVKINGQTYERQTFPTDVLDLDDGQPPALYVAGEVFDDTQQSKRAREQIEEGELNSYSISGEALVTRKKVEDGVVYDDIVDMDLSAVTLCEEGMNQGAKYARVDAEVSDKELAGEATAKRSEVPVLEHPAMSNPEPSAGESQAASTDQAVAKNMSNQDSDGEAKSEDGASIEDVLKRLPEEGEIATKDDLEKVEARATKAAEKAVAENLPDGSLATVDAMESMVDEKVMEYNAPDSDVDEYGGADDGQAYNQDGPSGDDTTAGDQAPDQGAGDDSPDGEVSTTSDKEEDADMDSDDEMDPDEDDESVEEKADSVRSARDKLAEELGVDKDRVNSALTNLLEEGQETHEGEEDYEEEDYPDDGASDQEDKQEDEMPPEDEDDESQEDMAPPEMETDDGEDDEDDEGYERFLERLERDLPDDVWEVVREYTGTEKSEPDSPADILTGDAGESDNDSDVSKAVEEVLKGGAEVQGGTAVPTDPDEDQVDKQYSPEEDDDGAPVEKGESPALENFY